MKDILEEYDDLLGDLQSIGFEPWLGFMWTGQLGFEGSSKDPFISFAVIGPSESDCIEMIKKSGIFSKSTGSAFSTSSSSGSSGFGLREGTMVGYLESLFETGIIRDAGYYSDLEPKKNEKIVRYWTDPWRNDPYYFVKTAKEMFSNVDQVMSRKTYSPLSDKNWKPS